MRPRTHDIGANAPVWHLYLLIDPTTGPTNHARGTVFYVGYRKQGSTRSAADLRAWQSIPNKETEAKEYAKRLIKAGHEPVVEVIADQFIGEDQPEQAIRLAVAAVAAALHPAPLNVRAESIRVDAEVIERVVASRQVSVPESGVLMRADTRSGLPHWGVGEGDEADPERGVLWAKSIPPKLTQVLEAGPIPFLVYYDRTTNVDLFPLGTIISVDLVTGLSQAGDLVTLEFGGDEADLAAARQHFLYNYVDMDDPRVERLSGY